MSDAQRALLTTLSEILFRQINPKFLRDGRISSQVFEAPRSHEGHLSVDRSSLITPSDSYELFTNGFGLRSVGVCAVTVGEAEAVELKTYADPVPETAEHPANPAHALIDLSSLSQGQMKKRAGRLAEKARERGVLYQPE